MQWKNERYDEFEAVFLNELNYHALLKKKFLRRNNNPFLIKDLRKQIMARPKFGNIFNSKRNYENWCKYKRQRNLCLNLLRETEKSFYKNLDEKQVSDNKVFWKNVNSSKKPLVVKNSILLDDNKIQNIMNIILFNGDLNHSCLV